MKVTVNINKFLFKGNFPINGWESQAKTCDISSQNSRQDFFSIELLPRMKRGPRTTVMMTMTKRARRRTTTRTTRKNLVRRRRRRMRASRER